MNKFREIALAVGVIMLAIAIYFKPIFFDNKNVDVKRNDKINSRISTSIDMVSFLSERP